MDNKLIVGLLAIPGLLIVAVGLSALYAWPVQLLWNGILPVVFGIAKITFLQAWGLTVLASLLFKSSK